MRKEVILVKGLDNGYEHTKSIGENERIIFRSAFTVSDKVISGTAHINIDGKDYYIGTGKTAISKPDKTDHDINRILTLTNLAMSGSDDYYLVVGLPIGQYTTQNEKFIKYMMSYNNSKVIYHDQQMNIRIKDVTVYLQGAAVIYALNRTNGTYLAVDIGAYTIDVALIKLLYGKPTILHYDTWYKGISTLYSSIIEAANNKYGLTLDPSDAEDILTNKYLKVDGEKVDISFINLIIDNYLDDIFSLLELNYKPRTTDIFLFGGGAGSTFTKFQKHYPQTELVNDFQFANALGYYKIGLQKYYKYIIGSGSR